jgi:hypothetical protein
MSFRYLALNFAQTMAQLSPRMLNTDHLSNNMTMASFSPKTPYSIPVSPGAGMLSANYYLPSPSTRAPPTLEHSP